MTNKIDKINELTNKLGNLEDCGFSNTTLKKLNNKNIFTTGELAYRVASEGLIKIAIDTTLPYNKPKSRPYTEVKTWFFSVADKMFEDKSFYSISLCEFSSFIERRIKLSKRNITTWGQLAEFIETYGEKGLSYFHSHGKQVGEYSKREIMDWYNNTWLVSRENNKTTEL